MNEINKYLRKIINEYIEYELKFKNELLNSTELIKYYVDCFWFYSNSYCSSRFKMNAKTKIFSPFVNDSRWNVNVIN
jgi:hypothetical protein